MINSGLLAPNGRPVLSTQDVERTQYKIVTALDLLKSTGALDRNAFRETASDTPYSMPVSGNAPNGFGFAFGDSFQRTQRGVMEFSMPLGQSDVMDYAMKVAFENPFVAKALRIKTQFTCKAVANTNSNKTGNTFFAKQNRALNLIKLFNQGVWMYYTTGCVTYMLPEPGDPFTWMDILDPRMVRTIRAFGKVVSFLVPDKSMINAVKDPKGNSSPLNAVYLQMMPASWVAQIASALQSNPGYNPDAIRAGGEILIRLTPGAYITIDNRFNPIERGSGSYDGIPLQPYFSAAEDFRMKLAGDFAAAFVAKNLIALVTIGDPEAEADNYQRPDAQALQSLANSVNTVNKATWFFGDPTTKFQYITPDPAIFGIEKFANSLSILKNLLPSPFWYNDGGGSFAAGTIEIKWLREEVQAANEEFDREFWTPVYERLSGEKSAPYIPDKFVVPPQHDRNSLVDDAMLLSKDMGLYNAGALSVQSLLESQGRDFDVELARLREQKKIIHEDVFMPAFEQKQGIAAAIEYGIVPGGQPASPGDGNGQPGDGPNKKAAAASAAAAAAKTGGGTAGKQGSTKPAAGTAGGRPSVVGSGPQAENTKDRTPRPSERSG
jgi:hypothetical protein